MTRSVLYRISQGHVYLSNPHQAKRIREGKNLKQIELAERLGYKIPNSGKNDVSALELGKSLVIMKPEVERYLKWLEENKND